MIQAGIRKGKAVNRHFSCSQSVNTRLNAIADKRLESKSRVIREILANYLNKTLVYTKVEKKKYKLKVPVKERMIVTIDLSKDMADAIQEIADRNNKSFSFVCNWVMVKYLNKELVRRKEAKAA